MTTKKATKPKDPLAKHGDVGRPIRDRIVVFPDPSEEYSSGGIIIPDSAQEKPDRGLVVAVGTGHNGEAMTLKPGDVILYGKYAGTEIKLKGRDYLIMRESDALIAI